MFQYCRTLQQNYAGIAKSKYKSAKNHIRWNRLKIYALQSVAEIELNYFLFIILSDYECHV